MVAEIMRSFVSMLMLVSVALTLNACEGYEKGPGLGSLDTESPEDKEDTKWFGKFYGEKPKDCDDSYRTSLPFCNP